VLTRDFVGLPSPLVGRAGAGGRPRRGACQSPAVDPNVTPVAGMRPVPPSRTCPPPTSSTPGSAAA